MNKMKDKNPISKRHCMIVHAHYPVGEPRVEREAHALLSNGFDVDVLCLQNEGEQDFETIDGVQIHRLPVKRHKGQGLVVQLTEYMAFFILVFLRLFTLHMRHRYRTVQVHNLPDFLVFATLFPKLMGANIILDLHDLMPEFFAGTYNRSMQSLPVRLLIFQEQASCWYADRVITVTEPWREALIERGVPAHKVSVVMNVANGQVFNSEAARRLSGDDKKFKLIYHGTLTYRYGIDLLLHAVAIVRESVPHIHLVIHGRGEFLQNLQEMAKELGLNGHVTFSTILLPVRDLPELIRQADVGIVPYRRNIFTDGILPTKLMEYTALHIPAIAARTPVIESYFDRDMVQFFPAEDVNALAREIIHLYKNPERRAQLTTESNRFNVTYNWENIARQYQSLVSQLAAE